MILLAKYGLAGKVIKANNDTYAISVHPGAVSTAMQEQWKDAYPGITGKLVNWATLALGRDVKRGSYSALWALTSDKIAKENMNGWYFNDPDSPGESAQASDPALGTALFELSKRIIQEVIHSKQETQRHHEQQGKGVIPAAVDAKNVRLIQPEYGLSFADAGKN